jgi:signal transduction histidine kinase
MLHKLGAALDDAVADPQVRAIVLTGSGRGFSTGMDQGGGAALDEVRRVARGLRPPALDELGLLGALRQVAADVGIQLQIEDERELPPLPAAVEVAAYRIAAEALTNVARHAGDRRAGLFVAADPGELMLTVIDHGRGSAAASGGVGVLAMRERAEELGGTLRIGASPGGGTTVEARLPSPVIDGVLR